MFRTNEILKIYLRLERVKYFIDYLENWNKENGKSYINFSNSVTNGNGCMSLPNLYSEEISLSRELKNKINKCKNYYENNFKVKTNILFK